MVERRLTGMIAAAAVLIVLFIFWDAFRPTPRPVDAAAPAPAPGHLPSPRGDPHDHVAGNRGARRPERSRAFLSGAHGPVGDAAPDPVERLDHVHRRDAGGERR